MELNFMTLSVIVGALLPLVISLLKGVNMSKNWKQFIAVACSAVAAFVTVGADSGWTFDSTLWGNLIESFGVIFALAQTTYWGFWQDKAVEVRLANVGSNTTPA